MVGTTRVNQEGKLLYRSYRLYAEHGSYIIYNAHVPYMQNIANSVNNFGVNQDLTKTLYRSALSLRELRIHTICLPAPTD